MATILYNIKGKSMGCACLAHRGNQIKPLVGIQPEWLWREIRVKELIQTIERYVEAKTTPLPEWFTELATHVEILKTQGILK